MSRVTTNKAAQILGRIGGSKTSAAKKRANKRNAIAGWVKRKRKTK